MRNITYPDNLAADQWALNGKWLISPEKITSSSAGASIKLHFIAGKVYIVMGAPSHPVTVKLLLNGKPVTTDAGSDVLNSQVQVIINNYIHWWI